MGNLDDIKMMDETMSDFDFVFKESDKVEQSKA